LPPTPLPVSQEKNQVLQSLSLAAEVLTNILKATGGQFDQAEVTKVIDTLRGKKLEDVPSPFYFS